MHGSPFFLLSKSAIALQKSGAGQPVYRNEDDTAGFAAAYGTAYAAARSRGW